MDSLSLFSKSKSREEDGKKNYRKRSNYRERRGRGKTREAAERRGVVREGIREMEKQRVLEAAERERRGKIEREGS